MHNPFHKKKNNKIKIISIIGSVILFVVIIIIFNYKGLIPEKTSEIKPTPSPEVKTEQTNIKINSTDISGKIISTQQNQLIIIDPETMESTTLAEIEGNPQHPGVISDGRIYFWQSIVSGNSPVYSQLYLQQDDSFTKFNIPLISGDNGGSPDKPPIISSDGSYVLYISSKNSQTSQNYRSIYRYNLQTFEEKKLTDNTLFNVKDVFVSPDSVYIGFIHESLQIEKEISSTSLGVIINGNDTVNLFTNVEILSDYPASFTSDSQKIIFSDSNGTQIFNLNSGKIIQTIKNETFAGYHRKGTIITQAPSKKLKTKFLKTCGNESSTDTPLNLIYSYQMKDNKYKDSQFISPEEKQVIVKEYPDQSHFNPLSNQIIVHVSDEEHCKPSLAILNTEDQTLKFFTQDQKYPFWVGE